MAKQSGMGMNYYVAGWDVSGDTNAFTNINGGPKTQDATDITQLAHARLGLQRDGDIAWTSFFNPTNEHLVFSPLVRTDMIGNVLFNPLAIGSPAVSIQGLLNKAETKRSASGELAVDYELIADATNASGLEMNGTQLTPGKRTDTVATNGASQNDGAATNFGFQAYLQAFALTGTDVTVIIQDSADNVTFANVAGGSFTQIISGNGNLPPSAQRIAATGTLRQYVRAITTTSGGFTSFTFAVVYHRNPIAVSF